VAPEHRDCISDLHTVIAPRIVTKRTTRGLTSVGADSVDHGINSFRNIQSRNPVVGNVKDSLSLRCIWRANLDAMWAREPTTFGGNLREVKKLLEKKRALGYAPESLVVPAGPFPLRDDQLMSVASTMMLRSLDAGKNEPCV
jgi:hypothetical protein